MPTVIAYKSRKHLIRTYTIIITMGVVSFVVRTLKFDLFSFDFQVKLFFTSLVLVSVSWEILRIINNWLNVVMPFEQNIARRMVVQLAMGSLYGVVLRFLLYYFMEPYLPLQLDSLFLATTWMLYIMIPIGVNLGFFTVYFIERWKDSIVKTERLEKEKAQVQFDNLKNQLNPHFLFNALTSLNSLITEDQALASQFLQQLSKVFRYVLTNKEKHFVSLHTEVDFIQHYVSLMKTRFKEAIAIRFDLRNDVLDRAIVPVTLQILLENAIKHNVVDAAKPLLIDIITIGDYLVVSNNLQVRKRVETSNGQGLQNLKSLYMFLTERPVIIENTGDRFSVKIPLL
jgi:two-component system, LytTR family, sensor kinase